MEISTPATFFGEQGCKAIHFIQHKSAHHQLSGVLGGSSLSTLAVLCGEL